MDLTNNILKQVCKQASISSDTSPCSGCSFILGTDKRPYSGGENVVFALKDHTGRAICMRIQRSSTEGASYALKNEVNFRKSIKSFGILGFQNVTGHAIQGNDLIRAPFITLEWAPGDVFRWTDNFPSNLAHRDKVIQAIAGITMDLLKIQKHGISAKDYVTTKINRKIERAERGEYKGGGAEECRRQFSFIESYWVPELDEAPHVLVHGDLGPNNIIVDEDFNLKSVIDLGWADMIPLQFAAEYPRFLTHEPIQICPGTTAFDWQKKNTDIMKRDRLVYLNCVRERADSEGGITSDYYRLLTRLDECSRYWWFKAISQTDIHKVMCACGWDPAKENILKC